MTIRAMDAARPLYGVSIALMFGEWSRANAKASRKTPMTASLRLSVIRSTQILEVSSPPFEFPEVVIYTLGMGRPMIHTSNIASVIT